MINSKMRCWIDKRYQQWIAKNNPPSDTITLNRRNIFILPTSNGLMFLTASAAIFLAAINYEISLAFGLTFLMVSIFLVTMLHTFSNLHRLKLTSLPTAAVFCGEDVGFQVLLIRNRRTAHESLELSFPKSTTIRVDLVEHDQEAVGVFAKAVKRGQFNAPRLRVSSCYPLGLFRAWSVIDMNLRCMVYPKPIPVSLDQITKLSPGTGRSIAFRDGADDFHGLREYVLGDSLKHVSWKNVARGQGMLVKQFVDYVDDRVWLDWDMFYGFSTEERLSRLCHCALKLSESDATYGLKMPGIEIKPDQGVNHRLKVLGALALYRLKSVSEVVMETGKNG